METGSTTICLADYASGRVKIVPLKAGAGAVARENGPEDSSYSVEDIPKLLSTQVTDSREFASLSDTLQNGDPRLCEAVLRSVFAPRAPGESLDDCVQNAEIVKRAFTLHDTVYSKAESRALKVAQYRRAGMYMLYSKVIHKITVISWCFSVFSKGLVTAAPPPHEHLSFL
jgi:hypothetical protein